MTIPATHAEIEQLYLQCELQECNSICLTSCQEKEGVTSIAMALTERFLLAGHSTILVDLNLFHPGFSDSTLGIDSEDEEAHQDIKRLHPRLIEHKESLRCFTGLTVPADSPSQLMYKRPDMLKKLCTQLREHYDRIIIDTSPLLNVNRNNIPAQSVATACDATILVVLAGRTSKAKVTTAITLLNQDKINLIGTVLNCRDQPTLAKELTRQVDRLPLIPTSWKAALTTKILKCEDLASVY